MKKHFDKHAESRVFTPGVQVLVLLPSSASPFCTRCTGPYTVLRKMTDQNGQIATPDRQKATELSCKFT